MNSSQSSQVKCKETADSINPFLPNEVLFKVLGYVDDPKDLLPLRTLSRAWNEMTSHHIFQKGLPVKFFTEVACSDEAEKVDESIQKFLETMEHRLQETKFPFSAYEFYLYQCWISSDKQHVHPCLTSFKKMAATVGPFVKHYAIHLEHFFGGDLDNVLEVILEQAPNLEKLCLYGQNSEGTTTIALKSSFHLPKLKYIAVMPYSQEIEWIPTDSDHDGPGRVKFNQFSSWISNAPALQVLTTGFGIEVTSEIEAKEYFRLLQQFDAVELHLKQGDILLVQKLIECPLPSLHTLYLDLEISKELVVALLKNVGDTLHKLNLFLRGSEQTIPSLPNLEILELDFDEYDWDNPIERYLSGQLKAVQFPNLKSLTLRGYRDADDEETEQWSLFDGSIFETVEHLNLINCDRSPPGDPWDVLFPNAKSSEYQPRKSKLLNNSKRISLRQLNVRSM